MIINFHTAHLNYTNDVYKPHLYQIYISNVRDIQRLILFSSGGSQFGSGCPTFANINLISQKVHKVHKVDVLCGVNAFIILQGFE